MSKALSVISLLLLFILTSCSDFTLKGSLVINNESTDSTVTSVYVSERGSSNFSLVFNGEIEAGKSYFIELSPGSYAVRILTKKTYLGFLPTYGTYETGYNSYGILDGSNALYLTFDGSGIFFD